MQECNYTCTVHDCAFWCSSRLTLYCWLVNHLLESLVKLFCCSGVLAVCHGCMWTRPLVVCCWVVVVFALLAPAERVVARAQHTCSELRVQRNPSGPRFQRLSSNSRFQRELGSPRSQCVMAAVFGKIEEFNEDWPQYVEQLGHFFQANRTVEEDKKRSIFLTVVGSTAIKLLRNLVSPVKPGEKTYNALVKVLTEHYQPTPLQTVQCCRFHSRFQKPGE